MKGRGASAPYHGTPRNPLVAALEALDGLSEGEIRGLIRLAQVELDKRRRAAGGAK